MWPSSVAQIHTSVQAGGKASERIRSSVAASRMSTPVGLRYRLDCFDFLSAREDLYYATVGRDSWLDGLLTHTKKLTDSIGAKLAGYSRTLTGEDLWEEMVNLRNQADGLIHAARKAVKDAGDKASDTEKSAIESAATALEEAMKGEDKADIEANIQALSEASAALAQKMYAEEAAAAGGQPGGAAGSADGGSDPDAVDAEFEEVDDDASRGGENKKK